MRRSQALVLLCATASWGAGAQIGPTVPPPPPKVEVGAMVPPPPPPASASPAWTEPDDDACTVDKLLDGMSCLFELPEGAPGTPDRRVADQNEQLVQRLASRCEEASTADAKVDRDLLKVCRDELLAVSRSPRCSLEGTRPLADERGLLDRVASECFESVAGVLSKTRGMAQFTGGCCRCMTQHRCASSYLSCQEHVAVAGPSADESSCIKKSCSSECAMFDVPSRKGTSGTELEFNESYCENYPALCGPSGPRRSPWWLLPRPTDPAPRHLPEKPRPSKAISPEHA